MVHTDCVPLIFLPFLLPREGFQLYLSVNQLTKLTNNMFLFISMAVVVTVNGTQSLIVFQLII